MKEELKGLRQKFICAIALHQPVLSTVVFTPFTMSHSTSEISATESNTLRYGKRYFTSNQVATIMWGGRFRMTGFPCYASALAILRTCFT